MTRNQALTEARNAANKAKACAQDAENAARHTDFRHKAEPLARAGRTWAETSVAYTALAELLTETEA